MEFAYLALIFASMLVIFKIAFFREDFFILLRVILSIFWLFVLPGYFIMLYWHEKLDFLERFVIGIAVAAGLIGTLSYYLGLSGLHIKYHAILLPLAIIASGFIASINKKSNH